MGARRYKAFSKAEKINSVGLSRIRKYLLDHHPQAALHHKQHCAIIRDYCLYGVEHCAIKYGLAPGTASVMLKRYYEYALAAEKEDKDGHNENTLR